MENTPAVRSVFRRVMTASMLLAVLAFGSSVAGAATLKLPTGISKTAAYRMYSEQVDSQRNITRLVDGEMSSFDILGRTVTSTAATFRIKVRLANGASALGVMTFKKYNNKWYFDSIKRATVVSATGRQVTDPDVGVLNTMLEQQTANQDVLGKLVNGTYTRVTLGAPDPGFNSTVVPVTFSGSKANQKGEITAIKRAVKGKQYWFLVSFAAVK